MFQVAFSIMGMLEYGIGNAFSFSVLPDRGNGSFFKYMGMLEYGIGKMDAFFYWNAKTQHWGCQIARMDSRMLCKC
jgi:hypothetical protein